MKLVRLLSSAAGVLLILSGALFTDINAAAAAAAVVPKARPALTGHKATYELSLLRTKPGEGVRAARGTMTYVLSDRCDGYTIESSIAMTLAYADGESQNIDQRYAGWEAKDGRSSSFSMQTLENGKASKIYRGTIALNADGSGTATYEADKPVTFDLAPGTMLSTAHTIALLENAAAGKKFFRGRVIDGAFDRGPFVITAMIAGGREAQAALAKGGQLSAGRYWPISLAYFPVASKDPTPEYELGMDMLSSGISRSMVQDFGDFSIGFKLIDLEPLKPDC
ncbi:MAG: DUF1849 family protein [Rhodospirillaceae bacterium]